MSEPPDFQRNILVVLEKISALQASQMTGLQLLARAQSADAQQQQKISGALLLISQQLETQAKRQIHLEQTVALLIAELRKPAETDVIEEIKNLLAPLLNTLKAISQRLQ